MPEMRSTLDFGCGPAPVLVDLLRNEGLHANGYDPLFAPAAIEGRAYDAVFCVETFEHFRNPAMDVARVVRAVRRGGLLVVMTLWHPGAANLVGWWYLRDPTHVAFYSPATMAWIAQRHGLRFIYRDSKNTVIMTKDVNTGALHRPDKGDGQ